MPFFVPLIVASSIQHQAINLNRVTIITSSGRVAPQTYRIAPGRTPAITIKGSNVTIDFQGAELQGSDPKVEPDQRSGTGVSVSGSNVTILNAKVRGYKVGLIARDVKNLKLVNCDFSYNWKPRLLSTLEKEDLADWMSYHQNEKDEWLRYGAGIYLKGCNDFEIKGCKAEGGGNGLMLTQCNRGKVWNNSFSFLSAIGLGMYRSSENRVMHNKIDWCVRGFSYGVYNRGQDSAGILIYEQSNKNVFAYNSVTHGGDGFFLWAGQTTMDTGKGGCNDNLLYGNDFSHAPTNGIEATFSRNAFVNNLILECWHGVWGGYSYESRILGNTFGFNAEAIAIEHGQDNRIEGNQFHRDNDGVHLWFNDRPQDPNWGYPKYRDTKSRNYTIQANLFQDIKSSALRINNSVGVDIFQNGFQNNGKLLVLSGKNERIAMRGNTLIGVDLTIPSEVVVPSEAESAGIRNFPVSGGRQPLPAASSLAQGDTSDKTRYLSRFDLNWNPFATNWQPISSGPITVGPNELRDELQKLRPQPLEGGMNPFLKKGALRGWRYMMVDEWGPYDFKSPLLWPREATALGGGVSIDKNGRQITGTPSKTQRFEILGPKGKWRLISHQGYSSVSASQGQVPGSIDATILGKAPSKTSLILEYIGEATVDYRGVKTAAGKAVRFSYIRNFTPIDWTVKFFKWKESANATDVHAVPNESSLQRIFAGTPLKELHLDKLDFAGYAFDPLTGNDHYATIAEGVLEVEPGNYTIELTTDDGARVWLDGKPLIEDAWKYQGPTSYIRSVKLGGKHRIRVEHFQIDGYAALKLAVKPKGT